jgi:hypothetical protein
MNDSPKPLTHEYVQSTVNEINNVKALLDRQRNLLINEYARSVSPVQVGDWFQSDHTPGITLQVQDVSGLIRDGKEVAQYAFLDALVALSKRADFPVGRRLGYSSNMVYKVQTLFELQPTEMQKNGPIHTVAP